MLASLIFAVGCGNNEQNAAKDTQPKAEQTTKKSGNTKIEQKGNDAKESVSQVIKAEINEFASKWLDEVAAMNYRLTDLEKSAGKNGVSKVEMERFVSAARKNLDEMNTFVVNYLMEFKENGVSKANFNRFVAEAMGEFDSLGVTIAKVELKVRLVE